MSTSTSADPSRSPLRAIWPLLLIMALMLGLSLASVMVVSWTRSSEHGLTLWATAEHQAVHELQRYAETGDEAHFDRFQHELAVPAAFERARLQLKRGAPDFAQVRASLVEAGIPERDVPGVIRLFSLLEPLPPVVRALEVWSLGGALASEFGPVGAEMHAEFQLGADPVRIAQLRERLEGLHARIQPLVREFASMMSLAAHQIVRLLMVLLPLCAAALVAVGFALHRALDQRALGATQALHRLASRLEHQASHDALTGLVNRPRFEALLADALTRGKDAGAALMYLDLDQFKVVNDTCGHAAGDELLRQMSCRLQALVAHAGTLGRLGGDEFGLLLPRHSLREAEELAERLRREINEQRFYWKERMFAVSASIGVVPLDRELRTVAEALSAADQACYLAKENGRDRVHLYLPDDKQVRQRWGEMYWIERLQTALDRDELTLVAQEIRPVMAPASGGPLSSPPPRRFELLLRMNDPDGQLVPPMSFIPAAERYGLMPRVDRWVIARACTELALLRDSGLPLPTCMVNLSGASASDPRLADFVASCLAENGLEGRHLGVELTETAAVHNLEACSDLMARLRRLGCPIALDDFGSGMSSFSYLRNLPIDYLKIDRAFICNVASDPIDHAMVETIQRIGGIMDVRTVAEGVESEDVLAALSLIGVHFAQGNHIRRPVPLVQMHTLVGSSTDTARPHSLAEQVSARAAPA